MANYFGVNYLQLKQLIDVIAIDVIKAKGRAATIEVATLSCVLQQLVKIPVYMNSAEYEKRVLAELAQLMKTYHGGEGDYGQSRGMLNVVSERIQAHFHAKKVTFITAKRQSEMAAASPSLLLDVG